MCLKQLFFVDNHQTDYKDKIFTEELLAFVKY